MMDERASHDAADAVLPDVADRLRVTKVRELSGVALDWAVASCLGWSEYVHDDVDGKVFRRSPHGFRCDWRVEDNAFSEDWALAGPIIAESRINIQFCRDLGNRNGLYIHAEMDTHAHHGYWRGDHEKPLVAAMRCFVSSVRGEQLGVPVELLPQSARATARRLQP